MSRDVALLCGINVGGKYGEGTLCFSRLTRAAAQSHLTRVITTPA